MMEAEIDPSAEPMVVDSSSDCSPYGKGVGAGGNLGVLGGSGPVISSSGASLHHSSHSKPQHSQFSRIQGLVAKGKEDLDVIEVHFCDFNDLCYSKALPITYSEPYD